MNMKDRNTENSKTYLGPCLRCLALALLSIIGLGTWVSYDSAAAIQKVFMEQLDINNYQYSLVYSVCAWPNILLCLVGGYLIDRLFGIRLGMIVYCVVATLGQLIFTLGVLYVNLTIILTGKLIFGIGMEAVFICLQFYAVHLFPPEQVPMITCVLFSLIRLGSSLIYYTAPPLYNFFIQYYPPISSLSALFAITVAVLVISTICAIILSIISSKVSPSNQPNAQLRDTEEAHLPLNTNTTSVVLSDKVSSLISQIIFPMRFWVLCVVNVSYTTALYVLLPFSQDLFVNDYGMDIKEANLVPTVHFIISALLSPVIGWTVDRLAVNIDMNILMGFGILSASIVYILLAVTKLSPYISMIILSISYALWTSLLTPSISRSVSSNKLATAFGMCQALFNLMYSLNIVLAGIILRESCQYLYLHIFILAWIAVGLMAVLFLRLRTLCCKRRDSNLASNVSNGIK